MNIFRNNSSQNQDRGKSVGGKMFISTGLRNLQPKFIQQLNSQFTHIKHDNQKGQKTKLLNLGKQNIEPLKTNQKQNLLKYSKVRGFHNIGNTCYFNSILQCLLHLPLLNQPFYNGQYKKQSNKDHPFSQLYSQIVKQLIQNSSTSPLNPANLKKALGTKLPRFLGHSQQDAQQCLTGILECINDELSRVTTKPKYRELEGDPSKKSLKQISDQWYNYYKERDNSIVCDIFGSQLLSKVTCTKCKTVSVTFDTLWGLPLDLTKKIKSIPEILTSQLGVQTLIEDFNCSKCSRLRNCIRTSQFFRLPNILVLQLKRFEYGRWIKEKIKVSVKIEKNINMKPFLSQHAPQQSSQYQLVGIVNHYGQTDYGHYTSTVFEHQNQKWYDVNDSKFEENKNIQGSTQSAYLLFYEKL